MRYVLIVILGLYPATALAKEVVLSPNEKREITAHIQGLGYNCPLAKLAWSKGQDAYGAVFKIFCGPTDREGTYQRAIFRFTIRPNNMISVEPWPND